MESKKMIFIALIVFGIVFLYLIDFPTVGSKAILRQVECNGVIDSIEFADRGYPYFWIDNNCKDFGPFGYSMVRRYGLAKGDSIYKKRGEASILTFKRDTIRDTFGTGMLIHPE